VLYTKTITQDKREREYKVPVVRATFSCNSSGNNVVLQVEIVSCAYYHLLAQQIFMLQKVDIAFTLFVARGGDNTRNKQSQLATQHCCMTSCTKMVPILLSLKRVQTLWESTQQCEFLRVRGQVRSTVWSSTGLAVSRSSSVEEIVRWSILRGSERLMLNPHRIWKKNMLHVF